MAHVNDPEYLVKYIGFDGVKPDSIGVFWLNDHVRTARF